MLTATRYRMRAAFLDYLVAFQANDPTAKRQAVEALSELQISVLTTPAMAHPVSGRLSYEEAMKHFEAQIEAVQSGERIARIEAIWNLERLTGIKVEIQAA